MAVRPILHFPDERLRDPGKPVVTFDAAVKKLVDDMAETMYAAPGVGLAAPQVGVSLRLFIVDIYAGDDDRPSDLRVFVNPEIVEKHGEVVSEEGCLSFPDVREEVRRAERIRIRAQDVEGRPFELEADGFFAVAIQHEHDHLDGVLLVDHLSLLRRRLVRRSLAKRAAEAVR
jgi:peptide deformylase